ncbi:hypothetical protein [Flavivirga eckloniae]|uniref:Uncharacterized protein n=1 Tax=Flavivirga eckloniae TaxID=1803846 RepID=A0A2K9PU29_9FLAO|nr:hypothetical protein [Flavivirga eckloniae]AUP80554.1 hypothetical protein C1H87_18280 [Flavivirga eckloniae]
MLPRSQYKIETYYQFLGTKTNKIKKDKVDVEKIRMRLSIMQMDKIQTRIVLKKNNEIVIGIVSHLEYEVDKNDNHLKLILEDKSEFSIYTKKIQEVDRADRY